MGGLKMAFDFFLSMIIKKKRKIKRMRLMRPLDSQINLTRNTAGDQSLKTIGCRALGFAIDSARLGSCAHKDSDWLDIPCNATAAGLIIVPRCKDLRRLDPAASNCILPLGNRKNCTTGLTRGQFLSTRRSINGKNVPEESLYSQFLLGKENTGDNSSLVLFVTLTQHFLSIAFKFFFCIFI